MKPKILLPGLLALLMALGALAFTSGLTLAQGPVGSGSGSPGYGSGPYDYGPGGSGMYPGMGWPENVNLPPALSFLQDESPQQIYQQMRGIRCRETACLEGAAPATGSARLGVWRRRVR